VIFHNKLLNYRRVYIDYILKFESLNASQPELRNCDTTSAAEGIDVRPAFFCVILYVVLCCGCWGLRAAQSEQTRKAVQVFERLQMVIFIDVPKCILRYFWIMLVSWRRSEVKVSNQYWRDCTDWHSCIVLRCVSEILRPSTDELQKKKREIVQLGLAGNVFLVCFCIHLKFQNEGFKL
jgi:hypothetical protein